MLPKVSHDDERVKPVFSQLMDLLRARGIIPNHVIKEGKDITHHDGIVILPCIAASRVGSDLAAALDKAKLGEKTYSIRTSTCQLFTLAYWIMMFSI